MKIMKSNESGEKNKWMSAMKVRKEMKRDG